MPRYARDDDGDIYRLAVTTTYAANEDRGETSSTIYYGPYQTLQAVNAQATRHRRGDDWYSYRDRNRSTETKVQRTAVSWEDVDG